LQQSAGRFQTHRHGLLTSQCALLRICLFPAPAEIRAEQRGFGLTPGGSSRRRLCPTSAGRSLLARRVLTCVCCYFRLLPDIFPAGSVTGSTPWKLRI